MKFLYLISTVSTLLATVFSFSSWAHIATIDSYYNTGSGALGYSYILRYKDLAIREMHRIGIPASITLAQGMYESGFGKSALATQGNNHFGIKCKNDWKGATISYTDDAPNECFRKYKSVYESYIDHSNFLAERSHYRSLFNLPTTNYRAWAEGLKRAGYATDPDYSNKIIAIIQRFRLYEYDELINDSPLPAEQDDWVVSDLEREYSESALYGAPLSTPSYRSKLQQIDAILSETIRQRPANEPPRNLSGDPVIFVGNNTLQQLSQPTIPIKTPPNNNTVSESVQISSKIDSNTNSLATTHLPAIAKTVDTEKTAMATNSEKTAIFAPVVDTNPSDLPAEKQTQLVKKSETHRSIPLFHTPTAISARPILRINQAKAVRYSQNVTLRQLSKIYDIWLTDLLYFNEMSNADEAIPANTYVYLTAKRTRYGGEEKQHIVQTDDNMWLIAQKYGITLQELYARNAMREHTQPLVGEKILLKGKADYPPKIRRNNQAEWVQKTLSPNPKTVFKQTALLQTDDTTIGNKKVQYHLVKANENVDAIAKHYHTSPELINEANQLPSKHHLQAGEILLIVTY